MALMFAVIKTGGKQYLVQPGQKLRVEKLAAPKGGEPRHGRDVKEDGLVRRSLGEGGKVIFDEVLLVSDDKKTEIGTPLVKEAKVEAKVLKQGRDRKILVFKYHAKTRYRKKKGHRQPFTEVEITKIVD